jgi:CheY-like chemotaxis protein
VGLDGYYYDKRRFAVYTYNNPVTAQNFYDLLLTDIYMPHMNGFELCQKVMELDANVKVCFISAAEINIEALREVYPKARSIGCFIKKPVTINYLVKRLSAELD